MFGRRHPWETLRHCFRPVGQHKAAPRTGGHQCWPSRQVGRVCVGLGLGQHLAQHLPHDERWQVGRWWSELGASDWLEHKEDYGFALYLSDAASLLALVAHEKQAGPLAKLIRPSAPKRSPFIDWVGTSMGGLIGMMLAARANSPIRRLVLNDVGPFISWQALARLKKLHIRRNARFNDLNEVQQYVRSVCAEFGPLRDEQWAHVAEHSVQPAENGGYELAWDPAIVSALRIKAGPDGVNFGNEFLLGFDLWPIWNAVRCPTLVLRGSKSTVLSAATAKRMRRSGPRARVVDISGVGHAPWLMSENQITIIRDFLLSPDPRGA